MENSEGGDMDLDNVGQGLAEIVNALNDEISMQIEPFQMPDEIVDDDGDPFVAIRHIEDFIDFFNPLERALARLNQSSSNGEAVEDILEPDIHRNDQQQSSVSFSQHSQPHPHNQTQHVEGSRSTHCQQTLVSNTQNFQYQPYTHNQTQQTEAGGSSTPARQDLQQQSRVHRHIQAEHPPAPTPSTQSTLQQSSDTNRQVGGQVRRPNFNNLEIRRRLNTTRPEDPLDFAAFYTNIGNNLNEAVQEVIRSTSRGDIVQAEIVGENVREHCYLDAVNDPNDVTDAVHNLLDRIAQSNTEVLADNSLELVVQIVFDVNGGGGAKRKLILTTNDEMVQKKKRCLYITYDKDDKLCFARSLAYLLDGSLTVDQATQRARYLQQSVGLTCETAVSLRDVHKFETLVKRKIVIAYRADCERPLSFFETQYPKSEDSVFLLLLDGHYYGIKSVKEFIGKSYFCRQCYKGHKNQEQHSCEGHCHICLDPTCKQQPFKAIHCNDCNKICQNESCFVKHKERRQTSKSETSNCEKYKKCSECSVEYYVKSQGENVKHKCPQAKCTVCGEVLPKGGDEARGNPHLCYMQPLKPEAPCKQIIYYDFETFIGADGKHKPYLVCTKSTKGVEKHWLGLDCVEQFLDYVRNPRFEQSKLIAHNAKGFDAYIILNKMVDMGVNVSVIMQGSKVICFSDTDYKLGYIDSLSFLTMPLSSLPKALGFIDQTKGYFPHGFSSLDHLNYIGPYPDPKYYGVERMSTVHRTKFFEWYEVACKGTFNFAQEALMYCRNDVNILATACEKFREEFLNATGTDPFNSVTIASSCMKVFRNNFLTPKTLAITPTDNYIQQSKSFSRDSIQYLMWVAHSQKIPIIHALNKGEVKIGQYYVDGYALIDGVKYVWEYLGCFYHGCRECYDPTQKCPMSKRPFQEKFDRVKKKIQDLKVKHGIQLVLMWEHEWLRLKKSNPDVREFLRNSKFPEPLIPRKALFGGRTNAFVLRYTAAPGERVMYVDVTSLYPFVNSTCAYPLGHPTIIHDNFDDPQKYFGFIRAKVNPPRGLYFPLLPYKTARGKLVFTLCRTCAELNNQESSCSHNDDERALTGVWVTPEFNKALELGYTVSQITEVWHFDSSSSDVFKAYIDTFLKGKQEASGYPSYVVDQAGREKYIENYETHQGIRLDPSKINVNAGKRQVSKLCLNNFWGKLGQRDNLDKTEIVSSTERFFELLFSGLYEIKAFHFLNDQRSIVQYSYHRRCNVPPSKTANIFAACMTTAYARLKMYAYLERLQSSVLYTDTDSLVYVVKDGESPLELGDYLGDLTDELGGDSIQEFVSAGPKSYAYQTRNSMKTVMKVKGITQTHDTCKRVNFDSIKNLVEGYIDSSGTQTRTIETPQHTIVRNKKGFHLKNRSFMKTFRVVYDKRRLIPHGHTLPFGY
ncbi:uncharacterized protein LOC144006673 [Festucalex cinctus]